MQWAFREQRSNLAIRFMYVLHITLKPIRSRNLVANLYTKVKCPRFKSGHQLRAEQSSLSCLANI